MNNIKLAVIVVGVIALVAGTAGQTTSPNDPLLAEVRALRAELNQAAGTSIRTQLLVARLQLQEQRINNAAKQLEETRTQLATTPGGLLQIQQELQQLDEQSRDPNTPVERRREIDRAVSDTRARLADFQRQIAALTDRESLLAATLASEQSRWLELNGRLDDIERELAQRPAR
jgi:chromosome segregation ATPase